MCGALRLRAKPCLMLFLGLTLTVNFVHNLDAVESSAEKNVLLLFSFSGNSGDFLVPLEAELRARVPWPVNFYVENLESQRFKEQGYQASLAETLYRSYAGRKLDLLIVVFYPALQFAASYRDRMFPGVPIVFMVVDADRLKGQKLWPNVTGATASVDIAGTFRLALRLNPDTNTIAVVSNTSSEFEQQWLAAVQTELQRHRDKLREVDLVGLPAAQLLQKVAALPPHTVVFTQLAPQNSVQAAIGTDDVVATIAQHLPTYCIAAPFCMGRGGVGTDDFDEREQDILAASMAARVLAGERPENIPIAEGTRLKVLVDWRQLRHWNIPEAAVPPGAEILYREPTLWQRDRNYILAALTLIVAQFVLIVGLLWQRARKRKAEAVLRESEDRFRRMADTTPALIWMCNQQGKMTYLNSRRFEFTGPNPIADYRDRWMSYLHPDDRKEMSEILAMALGNPAPFSMEYRLRRFDGVYRWMFDIASPRLRIRG